MDRIAAFIESGLPNKSAATRKAYAYSLNRFAEYIQAPIDSITRADVQQYVSYLQTVAKKSASTVHREFAAIAAFCRWLNNDAATAQIRLPKTQNILNVAPKSLEKNERNRLLREVERDGNVRNTAIINVMMRTGLRVSELVALDRNDVVIGAREESSYVIVRDGKGGKERKVPLNAEARHYLKAYLDTRADVCEALFVSERGAAKRIGERNVQKLCEKYGVNCHALRHTRAKTMVDAGIDLVTIAQVLGHGDLNTTRRYLKPTMEDMVKAMERADI